MTLENFEASQSEKNLARGREYFRWRRVLSLKKTGPTGWEAIVKGRTFYEVFVALDDGKVKRTSCDCPVFSEDANCKHVVAVLYALQGKFGLLLPEPGSLEADMEAAVDLLPPDQLKIFLKRQLEVNPKMTRALDQFAMKVLDADPIAEYIARLERELPKYADKRGHIPHYFIPDALKLPLELMASAKQLIDDKNFSPALNILIALIQVLAKTLELAEDKDGSMFDIIDNAFGLLLDMGLESEVDEYTLKRLYRHAIVHVREPQYPLAKYDPHWIEILTDNLDSKNDEEVIMALDQMIAGAGFRKKKAELLRLENLKAGYIKMITPRPVEKAPKVDKYPEYTAAKKEMTAKMEKALEDKDEKTYAEGRQPLLEMMLKKSDIFGVREWAARFYKETQDPKYLENIKDTYMNAEWEKAKEKYM